MPTKHYQKQFALKLNFIYLLRILICSLVALLCPPAFSRGNIGFTFPPRPPPYTQFLHAIIHEPFGAQHHNFSGFMYTIGIDMGQQLIGNW
jgi:hypothetical protein